MLTKISGDFWRPWFVLAAAIGAIDLYAIRTGRRTLSTTFADAAHHPIRRWPTLAAWSYITVHLFGVLPPSRDPISRLATILSPARS